MKITHEFTVERSPQAVWELMQDVSAVAMCLPGAELTEDKGGGVYAGKVSVKLGPLAATFEGDATVTTDAVNRSATIDGKGVDRRGGSRGQVAVTYRVEISGSATKVSIDADVVLSGAAAQFGRTGLINEMSNRLIAEFVSCLEAKLGAGSEQDAGEIRAGEVRGFSLFFASLIAWLRKLVTRR
jgi:carbon monoxide dehydrogenase subunit G